MLKVKRAPWGALQADSNLGLGHTITASQPNGCTLAKRGIRPKGRRPDRVPGTYRPGERERRIRQLRRRAATGFHVYHTPLGTFRLAKLDPYERALYRDTARALVGERAPCAARPCTVRPRSRRPCRPRARTGRQSRAGPDADPGDAEPGDGEHSGAGRADEVGALR